MTFEQWVEALKKVAAEKFEFTQLGIERTDWSAYRCYYDDGLSPEEALAEDFSNA